MWRLCRIPGTILTSESLLCSLIRIGSLNKWQLLVSTTHFSGTSAAWSLCASPTLTSRLARFLRLSTSTTPVTLETSQTSFTARTLIWFHASSSTSTTGTLRISLTQFFEFSVLLYLLHHWLHSSVAFLGSSGFNEICSIIFKFIWKSMDKLCEFSSISLMFARIFQSIACLKLLVQQFRLI